MTPVNPVPGPVPSRSCGGHACTSDASPAGAWLTPGMAPIRANPSLHRATLTLEQSRPSRAHAQPLVGLLAGPQAPALLTPEQGPESPPLGR